MFRSEYRYVVPGANCGGTSRIALIREGMSGYCHNAGVGSAGRPEVCVINC